MELWDLYTRDRQSTGERHVRGEKMPPERYHLVVHVWIRNSRGEWLISQRSATCHQHPLKWECAGGSVIAGEDSLTAALREVAEEVGVQLDPENGLFLGSVLREKGQSILDQWIFRYDGEPDLAAATTDEVAQSRWMTEREIRGLIGAGAFSPSRSYFFEDPMLGGNA